MWEPAWFRHHNSQTPRSNESAKMLGKLKFGVAVAKEASQNPSGVPEVELDDTFSQLLTNTLSERMTEYPCEVRTEADSIQTTWRTSRSPIPAKLQLRLPSRQRTIFLYLSMRLRRQGLTMDTTRPATAAVSSCPMKWRLTT